MVAAAQHYPSSKATGPFATAVPDLRSRGLAPIPLGGDDGKVPLIRWRTWKHCPGKEFLERLIADHPTANVGILTGLSRVTVVDIDDLSLVDDMVRRFGNTPLKTSTPSGGVHLWYSANGERSRNRLDGLKVDIKAQGGMVVVPPSVRPSGPHAGKPYGFLSGYWDDLSRLPTLNPGSLFEGEKGYVREGSRNDELFSHCLAQARHCDTIDDLLDVARTFNAYSCLPGLPEGQVVKTARSAWRYQQDGRNWSGGPSLAVFTTDDVKRLIHNPDAFAFLAKLNVTHGARPTPFALDARAMRLANVMPGWGRNKYMAVIETLRTTGDLNRVYTGGKKPNDPHLYRLSRKGPKTGPNSNRTPSPPIRWREKSDGNQNGR